MAAVFATWFVLRIELSCCGHWCHLRNAGTSELQLVLQRRWVHGFLVINSHFNQLEFRVISAAATANLLL